ncbi:hypothetical protein J5289_16950 [Rhizobium sp. B230/85]|uniref:hypothetical protein n=1 Tax=unclassified Rhizobium TaxID=2613769 RepID=UPI001AD9F8BB|nr:MULTISPECIES: hypothetical protein [unclassified Rhizobium]MBO9131586.1 hypothetical protein [Rhizobium sp. B209b/85]MBO9169860.1 hypothetical protein [Rhizobium sp. L245/93]QXZ95841.1 hypothetical protein J5289_16950 [Rhizobium sp. B230/85]
MGIFVTAYDKEQCWICGSKDNLTREHKFKASDIRRHYGRQNMYVAREVEDGFQSLHAQGPNSKHLKFGSVICHHCNSTLTQASDRAYDQFAHVVGSESHAEIACLRAYEYLDKIRESEEYLNLFRYFAKLLGCHLADLGAPIPTHLSKFVAREIDRNCIWLGVQPDHGYTDMVSRVGSHGPYVAHGGLIVITKKPKLLPSRFHSTSTVGPIQFVYYYNLTLRELFEMRVRHPSFIKWCAEYANAAIVNPILEEKLKHLGF